MVVKYLYIVHRIYNNLYLKFILIKMFDSTNYFVSNLLMTMRFIALLCT